MLVRVLLGDDVLDACRLALDATAAAVLVVVAAAAAAAASMGVGLSMVMLRFRLKGRLADDCSGLEAGRGGTESVRGTGKNVATLRVTETCSQARSVGNPSHR